MQLPAPTAQQPPEAGPAPETEPRLQPLRPPGPHRIRVGTAGWEHPSLLACGRFYPADCRSSTERLQHYASRFALVEVTSTEDEWPSPEVVQAWADATPADFVFNLRVFRVFSGRSIPVDALPMTVRAALGAFTHHTVQPDDLPPAVHELMWESFLQALQPLQAAGKLGALQWRWPVGFAAAAPARVLLDDWRARLTDHLLAVAFDDPSWFHPGQADATLEFQKERGLVNVVEDGRLQGVHATAAHWEVTNPHLALVRLPGPPGAGAGADDHHHPDLSDAELENLAMNVRSLSQRVLNTHVVFDDAVQDRAQRHADRLMRLLGLGR